MRRFGKIALAAILAAMPVAAHATDLLTVPAGNMAVPVADTGFDWNGFYAGVFGTVQNSSVGGFQYGAGIDLGVNARLEFALVGGEIALRGLDGGTGYASALGKVGIALTDDVVLYGAGGLGTSFAGPAESDVLVGGGLELAVADDVTLDARYLHAFPVSGANPKDQFSVGANFHF